MAVKAAISKYLVKPGAKLDLATIDPSEKSLWEDVGKENSDSVFDKLRNELQHLQKCLYAQNKHRVLVVMQAMDTGGKDGCIKHVFSRIDPQGICYDWLLVDSQHFKILWNLL